MAKIIIIGGGIAGLTAGIYGQNLGLDCEIYEKNANVGGNLTGWNRKGCTIDNCIHWLTGTLPGNQMNEIWHEIGMLDDKVSLYRADYLYESRRGNESIALYADPEETRYKMLSLSPADAREINRFIRTAEALDPIVGSGSLPEKAEILLHLPDVAYYWKTNLYSLAGKFHHPLLRLLLTDYIGGEFSAMALLCAYTAFLSGNGSVPLGGSLAAASRIRERFLAVGGTLHTGTAVKRVVVRNGRACGILTDDGSFVPADAVICACDPAVTFGQLLPEEWMPLKMRKRWNDPKTPVFSSIHAAFLCDRAALVPFGTRIIDAPYFSSRSGGRLPVREYSHEADNAPDGKVLLQTLVFQTEQESLEWIALKKNPAAYESRKRALSDQMAFAIGDAMPELAESLEPVDFWTPATYHDFFGSRAGAYLSNAFTPSASLRPLPASLPGIRNLSLATQWLRSPGGLPIAALSGLKAIETTERDLRGKE